MEEKIASDAQHKALNDFMHPKFLGVISRALPSVDERIAYLSKHPEIPIRGPKNKAVMEALQEGLQQAQKTDLEEKINRLLIKRLEDHITSDPSVDGRLKFIFREDINLTSPKYSNEILSLLLTGLAEKEKETVIENLVRREKDRAMNGNLNTFMREPSLYKTAMMHHFKKEIEKNPKLINDFINNPIKFIENIKIPDYLKPLLNDVIQQLINEKKPLAEFSHTIIFSLASGPITDHYNIIISDTKQDLSLAKQKTNPEEVKTLTEELSRCESLFNDVKNSGFILTDSSRMLTARARHEDITTQLLEKGLTNQNLNGYAHALDSTITTLNKNFQSGSIIRDTENNRKLFLEKAKEYYPKKIADIQEKINDATKKNDEKGLEKLRGELEKYQELNEAVQTDNAQSVSEISSPQTPRKERSDRTLRGAMKVSSEDLMSELSSEEIEKAGIKVSPRTATSDTQSGQTAERLAEPAASTSGSETRPRSPIGIGTHRPPPPNFEAPSLPPDTPPASPRGKPMIGVQRTKSNESLPTSTPASPREEQKASKEEAPPQGNDKSPSVSEAKLEEQLRAIQTRLEEIKQRKAELNPQIKQMIEQSPTQTAKKNTEQEAQKEETQTKAPASPGRNLSD